MFVRPPSLTCPSPDCSSQHHLQTSSHLVVGLEAEDTNITTLPKSPTESPFHCFTEQDLQGHDVFVFGVFLNVCRDFLSQVIRDGHNKRSIDCEELDNDSTDIVWSTPEGRAKLELVGGISASACNLSVRITPILKGFLLLEVHMVGGLGWWVVLCGSAQF